MKHNKTPGPNGFPVEFYQQLQETIKGDLLQMFHNLKLLLFAFELASGLKINFHKSGLFCFEDAQDHVELYKELFGCKAVNFPINYLGIPIHFRKLEIVIGQS